MRLSIPSIVIILSILINVTLYYTTLETAVFEGLEVNIIFLIYDKDVFNDIKINSCEIFLALQGNSHKFRLQLRYDRIG
ncbi:unnamed protein product [Rhizophagus irregularis]|nr:unnamed protein product [Rhizophagus irregularis]